MTTFSSLTPDDPRLTAYALGELDDADRAAVEAALAADPALRAVVDDIRGFSGQLQATLAAEPVPASVKAPLAVVPPPPANVQSATKGWAKVLRFPGAYYGLASAAAACFALVVWMQRDAVQEADVRREAERMTKVAEAKEARAVAEAARAQVAMAPVEVTFPSMPVAPAVSGPLVESSKRMAFKGVSDAGEFKRIDSGAILGATDKLRSDRAMTYGSAVSRPRGIDHDGAVVLSAFSVTAPGATPVTTGGAEAYRYQPENTFQTVAANPLSTFAIDVDTASYANVRRFLERGQLPPADAVRIEELINYFPYAYAAPKPGDETPVAANLEVAAAPWNPQHRLVRIGLKGREVAEADRPAANLVFLLDVSGSMQSPAKLPLVKESMRLLLDKLRPQDRVAIVTYAGQSGLALPSTPASQKRAILAALDALQPAGSTNGSMGLQLAYDIAKANRVEGGINRIVLCTDGDFNVGLTGEGELVSLIAEKARGGTFLTVLGFGMGNYKDATLELLADKGNGAYGYIDTLAEARKLLVEQVGGTLQTIAQDVKVQVEFNPARVAAYRLLGYENRLLKKEDFNNDAVDAGELGAGHAVTALYEIVPFGAEVEGSGLVDALKYQPVAAATTSAGASASGELLTVKLRYQAPGGSESRKVEFPLVDEAGTFAQASGEFKFAAAVAGFGLVLRESPSKGAATYDTVLSWAEDGLANDGEGYRRAFVALVRKAKALAAE